MTATQFLDTNILLYSISRDPAETGKRERAVAILDRRDNAVSIQVLQEFYVQATRASRADRLPHDVAAGLIRSWLRFPVQEITLTVMADALAIKERTGLSYWDAAIVAAAKAINCGKLLSEDMTHDRDIDGVRIVNPFRPSTPG
jgi:predicted nucleic acid-binding protein